VAESAVGEPQRDNDRGGRRRRRIECAHVDAQAFFSAAQRRDRRGIADRAIGDGLRTGRLGAERARGQHRCVR
jgi:hypothetical protein